MVKINSLLVIALALVTLNPASSTPMSKRAGSETIGDLTNPLDLNNAVSGAAKVPYLSDGFCEYKAN
ncbi:hypothetical protein F8M41_000622 [Gigaspora margarita]|uniref:Pheromone n=1 Tax=Gigaspora margarita TaxID=4874 RepID=A0A8H3XFP6_GIGMA|nr:hypothetical protein F8M41_000622 [Gigaspora margarita]